MKINVSNLGMPCLWLPPKLLLIMRLIIVILTTCFMQVSASIYAQRVTLKEINMPVAQVLKKIKQQTGYDFLYEDKVLAGAKNISIDLNNVALAAALDKIFEGQNLAYSIGDGTVIVKPKEPTFLERLAERWAAIDVRGVVRNEKGEALEGITVVIKGTNRGTTTNAKGEFFLINVDEKATLVFSGVTIETYELKVKGKESMDVNVRTKQVQLEEVAVEYSTGYQKIPKERATGSFVFIDSATIKRRVDANILDRLKNLVPGLLFDKNRGSGFAGERLQLRGMYSFNESMAAPLIVVDNFPYEGDLNNINPNDVDNITILRDAAAASIWGARAGNGVIVITTKQGKFNQKAQITLVSSVRIVGKPDLFELPIVSSSVAVDLEQFLFEKGIYNSALGNPMIPVSKVALILDQLKNGKISQDESDKQLNVLRNTDLRNDYSKYVYRNTINQSHALNMSGGSSVIKYILSAGYNRDLFFLRRNENTRFTLGSGTTIQLFKNLEVQATINFSSLKVATNNSFQYGNLDIPNYYNLADNQGRPLPVPRYFKQSFTDTAGRGKLLDWSYRPLDELNNNDNTSKNQSFIGRVNLTYNVLPSLRLNIDYQYLNNAGVNRTHYSIDSYYARDLINLYSNFQSNTTEDKRYPVPMAGILDLSNADLSSHNLRSGFSYSHDWDNIHQINITGGAELSEKKTSFHANRNYGYNEELSTISNIDNVNPYPTYYGFSMTIPNSINQIYSQNNRFTALYGNAAYTYRSRYTLSASIRKDEANVFGVKTNQRGRPFWSTGLLWKVDKEGFYALDFLPLLNARLSLGNGGNTSFNNSALTTIAYNSAVLNPIINLPYADIRSLGNPDLRWEKVRTLNMGIDFAIKSNIISGSIEYYTKRSTDILALREIDATTGISFINANSASIKGSGIDINLNAKIIRSSVFNWNISGNLSIAKFIVNEYLYEQNLINKISNGTLDPIKGYNPYLISSYKWAGLDPATGDPQGYIRGQISKDWATITNSTAFDEIVKHGSGVPISFGNLINTISYKGFKFSTNLIYKFNYYFRRPNLNYFNIRELTGVRYLSSEYNERWKIPGDETYTNVPSFSYPFSRIRDSFYSSSEIRVEKGDHMRIDDFSLSYSLDKTQLKKLPFNNMSITANISNLNFILWKATESNLDPEYPTGNILPKSISLAFNLTF